MYESTTLFFGDIVGFTKLTAQSTATQTIQFLNDLYNNFDNAIDNYDVYKVEIVGDGYLVSSGVPYPNGKQHAKEIANMAIRLMQEVDKFKVIFSPTVCSFFSYCQGGTHEELQDADEDGNPLGILCWGSGRLQDATFLSLWRHRQHCSSDGVHIRGYEDPDLPDHPGILYVTYLDLLNGFGSFAHFSAYDLTPI